MSNAGVTVATGCVSWVVVEEGTGTGGWPTWSGRMWFWQVPIRRGRQLSHSFSARHLGSSYIAQIGYNNNNFGSPPRAELISQLSASLSALVPQVARSRALRLREGLGR